jgi:hypothetical protein
MYSKIAVEKIKSNFFLTFLWDHVCLYYLTFNPVRAAIMERESNEDERLRCILANSKTIMKMIEDCRAKGTTVKSLRMVYLDLCHYLHEMVLNDHFKFEYTYNIVSMVFVFGNFSKVLQ